jgi:hypothetical protein
MGIADLHNRESSPSGLYEAIIVGNPASVTDEIEVTIPAFDPQLKWGPMPWPSRVDDAGATVYPSDGDRCVVVLAETDEPGTPEPWCVGWWPS